MNYEIVNYFILVEVFDLKDFKLWVVVILEKNFNHKNISQIKHPIWDLKEILSHQGNFDFFANEVEKVWDDVINDRVLVENIAETILNEKIKVDNKI